MGGPLPSSGGHQADHDQISLTDLVTGGEAADPDAGDLLNRASCVVCLILMHVQWISRWTLRSVLQSVHAKLSQRRVPKCVVDNSQMNANHLSSCVVGRRHGTAACVS